MLGTDKLLIRRLILAAKLMPHGSFSDFSLLKAGIKASIWFDMGLVISCRSVFRLGESCSILKISATRRMFVSDTSGILSNRGSLFLDSELLLISSPLISLKKFCIFLFSRTVPLKLWLYLRFYSL